MAAMVHALRPIEILLIEDSPSDALLTRESLKESNVKCHVSVVANGSEAQAFLLQEQAYNNATRPDLIIMDLKLPRGEGPETLRRIKENPRFRHIPVIVLSSSDAEEDINFAYRHSANCYITKPVDLERFSEVISVMQKFWCEAVQLPSHDE